MDILSLTAVELAKAIREGRTTAVEATQAVLDRIAASEDTYHCYVTVEREKALQQAAEVQKKIEAGELTGPLAGVPFAIKDNMCTEGTLTTCSSKILENFVPTFSAEVKSVSSRSMDVESLGSWEAMASSTVAQSVTSFVRGPI